MASLAGKMPICRRIFRTYSSLKHVQGMTRPYSITGSASADKALETVTGGRIGGWLQRYEDMVGLTEVRVAQTKVIEAEQKFLLTQSERRTHQHEMGDMHSKLKEIHAELDKVQRGDDRYLQLLTDEYKILKDERVLQTDLSLLEQQEHNHFASLSSAVRESHEKERARTERTKYWSIIGSVIGAMLGIIGTSINNYLRMRELRGIVTDSAAGSLETKTLVAQLSDAMKTQHNQMQAFVKDISGFLAPLGLAKQGSDVKKLLPVTAGVSADSSGEQLESQTKEILSVIKKQDETLEKEMNDIKRLLATSRATDQEGVVVYVGPEMEAMLKRTENDLEAKIKLNALWTVAFVYGAFVVTIPILYSIFKGS